MAVHPPRTPRDQLRPPARLAAHEHLAKLLAPAEARIRVVPEAPDDEVRVWLAEEHPAQFADSQAPTAVWIIFKTDVPDGMLIKRTASSQPVILVDSGALAAVDRDPASQAILERALMTAEALVSPRPKHSP